MRAAQARQEGDGRRRRWPTMLIRPWKPDDVALVAGGGVLEVGQAGDDGAQRRPARRGRATTTSASSSPVTPRKSAQQVQDDGDGRAADHDVDQHRRAASGPARCRSGSPGAACPACRARRRSRSSRRRCRSTGRTAGRAHRSIISHSPHRPHTPGSSASSKPHAADTAGHVQAAQPSPAKSRKTATWRSISSSVCCTERVHWSSGPGGSSTPRLAR